MKVWIELNTRDGSRIRTRLTPKDDAIACEVPGVKCPCGADPLFVSGAGKRISSDPRLQHDTYEADAVCTKCDAHVGVIYAQVSTLFGLAEDSAVARMGYRIY